MQFYFTDMLLCYEDDDVEWQPDFVTKFFRAISQRWYLVSTRHAFLPDAMCDFIIRDTETFRKMRLNDPKTQRSDRKRHQIQLFRD